MEAGYRKVRVFVASPSDVIAEREAMAGVINELNTVLHAFSPDAAVVLELVRWETHTFPTIGRPQGIINDQVDEYDIFVGIMWKRFGSSTGVAGSGTEEEFRIALRRWDETRQPHIMFYFSAAPSPPPSTPAEIDELVSVVSFRTELMKIGLVWQYPDSGRFADVIRPHLAAVIGQIIHRPPTSRRFQQISRRERIQIEITEIAPDDAYYARREQLVGRFATPHTLTITGEGWSGGLLEFDTAPLDSDETRISLFRFRWEAQV
jgi:hypothetical protein